VFLIVIFNRQFLCIRRSFGSVAILLITLVWAAPASLSAGALKDYIKNPPHAPNAPWDETDAPELIIPRYQQRLLDGKTDDEKGIAVANLAFAARQMAGVPVAQNAARELLSEWVIPNLEFTKGFHLSSFCCWRKTVIGCRNAYGMLGDREAEKECLEMLYRANLQAEDSELMVYLLAFQQAKYGEYQRAIKTINFLDEDSRWAKHRKQLIRKWSKRKAKRADADLKNK